jgi:hypothetical protein
MWWGCSEASACRGREWAVSCNSAQAWRPVHAFLAGERVLPCSKVRPPAEAGLRPQLLAAGGNCGWQIPMCQVMCVFYEAPPHPIADDGRTKSAVRFFKKKHRCYAYMCGGPASSIHRLVSAARPTRQQHPALAHATRSSAHPQQCRGPGARNTPVLPNAVHQVGGHANPLPPSQPRLQLRPPLPSQPRLQLRPPLPSQPRLQLRPPLPSKPRLQLRPPLPSQCLPLRRRRRAGRLPGPRLHPAAAGQLPCQWPQLLVRLPCLLPGVCRSPVGSCRPSATGPCGRGRGEGGGAARVGQGREAVPAARRGSASTNPPDRRHGWGSRGSALNESA